MSDLAAKARRAAEWLKARETTKFCPEMRKGAQVGWLIQAMNTGVYFERTDREMIAFCEDRGWQDQELIIPTEEEAPDLCTRGMAQTMDEIDPKPIQLEDGGHILQVQEKADWVEWVWEREKAWVNGCLLTNIMYRGEWEWKVIPCQGHKATSAYIKGTAPTRAEARRQAVEAARGMNNDNV